MSHKKSPPTAEFLLDISARSCKCHRCGQPIPKGAFRLSRWILGEHPQRDRMTHAFHWICALAAISNNDIPHTSKVIAIHANIIENPQKDVTQKGKLIHEKIKNVLYVLK
jgi:hypothetical protein